MKSFRNFNLKKEVKCKFHDNKFTAFCNNDKQLLCFECINHHNSHTILSLDDGLEKNKFELNSILNNKLDNLKNKNSNWKKEFNNINNLNYKNKIFLKNLEKEINTYLNLFINKFEKNYEKNFNFNKNLLNTKTNYFSKKEEKLKNDIFKLNKKKNPIYLLSLFNKNISTKNNIDNFKIDNNNIQDAILSNINNIFDKIYNDFDNIKSLKTSRNHSVRNKSNNKSVNKFKRNKVIKNKSIIKINNPPKKNIRNTPVKDKPKNISINISSNKNKQNDIFSNKLNNEKIENLENMDLKLSISKNELLASNFSIENNKQIITNNHSNINININNFNESPAEIKNNYKSDNIDTNDLRLTIQNRIEKREWKKNKNKTPKLNNFVLESKEFIHNELDEENYDSNLTFENYKNKEKNDKNDF